MTKQKLSNDNSELTDVQVFGMMRKDPILRAKMMYKLRPQEVLPEYQELLEDCRKNQDYKPMRLSMFETFIKGRHITWQQYEILLAIKRAVNNE